MADVQTKTDAVCPRCRGIEWQPAHVTLSPTGQVLGLAYPLTCIACGTVRTMPVGGYPQVIAEAVEVGLRERVQRAQRLTAFRSTSPAVTPPGDDHSAPGGAR